LTTFRGKKQDATSFLDETSLAAREEKGNKPGDQWNLSTGNTKAPLDKGPVTSVKGYYLKLIFRA
jgi:hypothetical protein